MKRNNISPKELTLLQKVLFFLVAGFFLVSCGSTQKVYSGLSKAEQAHKKLHLFPFENSEKIVQQKFYSYAPAKKKFTWYDSSGNGYNVDLPRIAIRASKSKKEIFLDEKVTRVDVTHTSSDGSEITGEGYLQGSYLLVRFADRMYYSPSYEKTYSALMTDLLLKTKYSWPVDKEILLALFPLDKANVDIRHWSPYGEKWSPGINNMVSSMDPKLAHMNDATFIVYKFSGHGRQMNMINCLTLMKRLVRDERASTEEIQKELRNFSKFQENYKSDIGWYVCNYQLDNIDFTNGGDLYMWNAESDISSAGKVIETTSKVKGDNQGIEKQLKELKSLFNKGLITKEEYAEKKKALLDEM